MPYRYTPGYTVQIVDGSIAYNEELYAKNLETPITFDLEVTGEKAFTDEIQIMVDVMVLAGMSVSKQFSKNISGDFSGSFLLDRIGNIKPLACVDSKNVIWN